ncbi:MAG: stage II sporulation protein M [Bacteroidia bacterium]
MRETKFISQNKEKWEEFEKILASDSKDPDKLSHLFIQVSDDLSYSRTYYRNRMVRLYLNNLAQQIFTSLYKNKRTRLNRFGEFWKDELPQLVWASRRNLLISFVIFAISVFIGVFSCHQDPEFPKLILGNDYVEMTKENIKKHDPMAVYKKMHEIDMFFGIAINNLEVSVIIFLFGLFFSIGTVGCLVFNGIMVGAFQYFFYEQGLFGESALTIWMHGTLEMSAMVIAGAAGLTLGNGLVFPGTYSRMQSFVLSARRGLKILIGIAPIIVLAAIIESFVTRYTDLPDILRLSLILLSLFFILGYFVWYPWIKSKSGFKSPVAEARLRPAPPLQLELTEIHSNGELFKNVFGIYRKYISRFLLFSFTISVLYTFAAYFFSGPVTFSGITKQGYFFLAELFNYDQYPNLIFLNGILFSLLFFCIQFFINKELNSARPIPSVRFPALLRLGFNSILVSVMITLVILMQSGWAVFFLLTGLPFIFFLGAVNYTKDSSEKTNSIRLMFQLLGANFWKMIGLFYMLFLVSIIFYGIVDSPYIARYFEFLSWNFVMDRNTHNLLKNIFMTWSSMFGLGLVFPLIMAGMSLLYYSLSEIRFANALRNKIKLIGKTANN